MPESLKTGGRLRYKLQLDDGSIIDVRTSVVDMLRWEKAHGGQSYFNAGSLTDQLWVVWAAAKRAGLAEGIDQEGWASQVVDFEIVDEPDVEPEREPGDVTLDPTPPAP